MLSFYFSYFFIDLTDVIVSVLLSLVSGHNWSHHRPHYSIATHSKGFR